MSVILFPFFLLLPFVTPVSLLQSLPLPFYTGALLDKGRLLSKHITEQTVLVRCISTLNTTVPLSEVYGFKPQHRQQSFFRSLFFSFLFFFLHSVENSRHSYSSHMLTSSERTCVVWWLIQALFEGGAGGFKLRTGIEFCFVLTTFIPSLLNFFL